MSADESTKALDRKARRAERKRALRAASADTVDASAPAASSEPPRYPSVNRQTTHTKKKVLVLCSRGVTASNIELVEDFLKILPHGRKDSKFDKKEPLANINEIASLSSCHYCLYFEARKMKDLYMWVSKVEGAGPSIKFLVQHIKPMGDLRLTGNCLLGSRPILSFDAGFGEAVHLRLLRQMLGVVFQTPKGHPRSKPFHDHVVHFALVGGSVIIRHYQVVPALTDGSRDSQTLVEIGPRLTLLPIRIFAGSFGGETLYANGDYVSPNEARSRLKRKASRSTRGHVAQKEKRRERINVHGMAELPEDALDDVFDDDDDDDDDDV